MLLGLHELVGNAATPATCTQDRNDLVCAARLYKGDSFRDVLSVSMNVIIAKSSSSNMVLTRSRSGETRGEQTQQELPVTAGPGASTPAPESSSARVTDTGSGSTATTNIDATLKASDTRSRRSTCSKKKRLAELQARKRLAEMELRQAQAEVELQEIQLQRLRVEAESSDDEEVMDDLASVRIGTWLARPAPPPGGETRPPPHDASGGRTSRDAAHAATATYTGAPAGAHPLRDDDGYGKVRESVCAKTKGNIASDVSQGNISDKLIDVGTLAAALAQVTRSSREPPKYMQRLPVFDGKPERNVNTTPPAPPAMTKHESVTSARETTSPHNRRAYLKIVPVTLSGPHASIHTYALLDDGSTVTLIPASVADILGADGPESSMCIQGLGTGFKHERSRTVSLHIRGKYHSAPQKIEAARTVTRIPIEDLEQRTLGILAQKNRRLPDRNFNKKKQEAPTMPKSHLGALKRLDRNEQRAEVPKVIAATQDNRATPCDSSLSVISTHSAGAGTSRSRGKIKAIQDVNKEIINPVVPKRNNKHKKLCTYFHRSFNIENTTYPYPRLVNQVRPNVLNYYGPICVAVDRHKEI
ncbi:hypothetical protein SFRURICE_014935 [Spodoptera frugiperda]|nr:hypothetical protein SFRURICE_014935 [Spodoptera frugiperda]